MRCTRTGRWPVLSCSTAARPGRTAVRGRSGWPPVLADRRAPASGARAPQQPTSTPPPAAAACPIRAPNTCSSRPPVSTTRTARGGPCTSCATALCSTSPRMAAPPPSCRPRADTITSPASAPTCASVPKPPHASLPRRTRPIAAGRPLADASTETQAVAGQTTPPTLTALLALKGSPENSKVEYVIGGLELTGTDRESAAQQLADDAIRIRCGKSPMLARWRTRRDGGPDETGARKAALETYAKLGFGLRDKPANDDHLQGLVAELLWNRLMQGRVVCRDGRRLVRAHSPPGFSRVICSIRAEGRHCWFGGWRPC